MDSQTKQGAHKWEVLRDLSSETGQGKVWIVAKRGDSEPTERFLHSLAVGLVKTIKTSEEIESGRRDFEKAMLDFVDHRYTLGALKQLKNPNDEEAQARLRLEASIYAKISDPHLLKLLDVRLDREQWIVTEYQPNGTLEGRLDRFRGRALSSLETLRPLVNVLARLHGENLVHRDFKPGNIFIDRNGQLVLGDAGLAFVLDKEGRVTRTYESVGTQHYMPAWAYGRRLAEIRPTFDVFSVGKVIWAMVAGEPTCPLWYVLEDHHDLTKKFPVDESMHWVNWLLEKCVVEKEDQMQIHDGQELGAEMDLALDALRRNCVTPTRAREPHRRCRVCGVGQYNRVVKSGTDESIVKQYLIFQCDQCQHIDYFWREPI